MSNISLKFYEKCLQNIRVNNILPTYNTVKICHNKEKGIKLVFICLHRLEIGLHLQKCLHDIANEYSAQNEDTCYSHIVSKSSHRKETL